MCYVTYIIGVRTAKGKCVAPYKTISFSAPWLWKVLAPLLQAALHPESPVAPSLPSCHLPLQGTEQTIWAEVIEKVQITFNSHLRALFIPGSENRSTKRQEDIPVSSSAVLTLSVFLPRSPGLCFSDGPSLTTIWWFGWYKSLTHSWTGHKIVT